MTEIVDFLHHDSGLAGSLACPQSAADGLNKPSKAATVRQWHTQTTDGVPMGTIVARKRKDGTTGYRAQIVRKKDGEIVWRETQTFDRRPAAVAWLARREADLAQPGAMERKDDPALAAVIDRYIAESKKAIGRTKAQVLRTIKALPVAELRCSEIGSADLIAFAQSLDVSPSTVQNYLSHLGAVFAIARPMWGYPLNQQAIKDTFVVTGKMGITGKSRQRERRPTLEELDRLMVHFGKVKARRPLTAPMQKIIVFALFSTRRQEEITRITWTDYDKTRVMVRDMKHPGDKLGNDTWCDLPPEAAAIIDAMPKIERRIFPFTPDAISANFTRACKLLEIEDLHFHDLRHEGISRLFEMGRTIPQAASVSGHRSWQSLKRYSHMRQTGDKYETWKWKTP
jgi:integrase